MGSEPDGESNVETTVQPIWSDAILVFPALVPSRRLCTLDHISPPKDEVVCLDQDTTTCSKPHLILLPGIPRNDGSSRNFQTKSPGQAQESYTYCRPDPSIIAPLRIQAAQQKLVSTQQAGLTFLPSYMTCPHPPTRRCKFGHILGPPGMMLHASMQAQILSSVYEGCPT
ncbi:uncharacterized protein LY79DRAFT_6012 [Colletotrichum navitas]|uniref:Uncharacterized protein n=1 Tax=Colletotrichum navitas TaxID=681940 RepID=A0AAD8QCF9_9PEZI|nr:uncharacterized protein LY79DRAFT_6012 [Colletotrichum navitas]KAK1600083.1 hypothetical protein LY79DRAFT_6012 [Colletotrichum navitas]